MTTVSNQTEPTKIEAVSGAWEVEGLDPVAWPGRDFELLRDTPGFVAPEQAAKALAEALPDVTGFRSSENEKSGVERIFVLEKKNSPWLVRARLAGDGSHPDADYVQFALHFKCLVGTQADGRYLEKEVARGSLAEVAAALKETSAPLEARFQETCRSKSDHRLIGSTEELETALNTLR